ncbi:hypothetical protein EMIHUDRAFT_450203 [Emiliania huxleyi CCMP1516]|uniref:Glutamine amidotransferase type-2 domain-containing protein n=2 Tax=Emiliania huxleyi TaxID=2903 RepID=A0A0D3JUM1_EMIH1|nr:hypothetical protein EMIHUDRAFT_450203 [Emiliania huxleyi CCMP1516]EOD27206.1 hypothetical protein EMIHUDRAFT_450203 [Emiliania huxleyi CCMP1516]|eukprot:XP_005779635.1 hypothetical protein EMIHUDRAFT_450203 [Emiliania huxleyi CCMP1516]
MCRWLVYCGSDPILMSDLIFAPTNSLIHQSFNGGFHPGLSDQNNMQDGAPRETLLRNSHLIVGVGCPRERFCAALTSPNIAGDMARVGAAASAHAIGECEDATEECNECTTGCNASSLNSATGEGVARYAGFSRARTSGAAPAESMAETRCSDAVVCRDEISWSSASPRTNFTQLLPQTSHGDNVRRKSILDKITSLMALVQGSLRCALASGTSDAEQGEETAADIVDGFLKQHADFVAELRRANLDEKLNADGFGVGWYHKRGGAIFRSVTAAWNNSNLRELSESIESRCIFAHHNGHVEGFDRIKRRVFAAMRDDVYHWVQGTTDSEACFALILSLIEPELLAGGECVPVAVLRKAMLSAIATLRGFLADAGVFNFALTDGSSVVVARYCDKAPDIPPPSLYYAFASSHQLQLQLSQALTSSRDDAQEHTFRNQARLSRLNRLCAEGGEAPQNPGHGSTFGCTCPKCRKLEQTVEGGAFICASEPLTTNTSEWFLMKENSMISFTAGTPSADDESEAEECSRLKAMRLDQATPCQRAAFSKAVSTKAARNPTVTTSPAVPAQSPKRRSSWEALRSFVDEQGARPGPEAEAEARAREDPKSNLDVVSLD